MYVRNTHAHLVVCNQISHTLKRRLCASKFVHKLHSLICVVVAAVDAVAALVALFYFLFFLSFFVSLFFLYIFLLCFFLLFFPSIFKFILNFAFVFLLSTRSVYFSYGFFCFSLINDYTLLFVVDI